MPFFGTVPVSAVTYAVPLGSATPTTAPPVTAAQYRIPISGKLDTLQISNQPVGADAVPASYQVQKNNADVGSPVIIANNAAGPVRVDLSAINVLAGDLIGINVATPVFAGAAPAAKILLTWSPTTSA
jgi:hypothetical protein